MRPIEERWLWSAEGLGLYAQALAQDAFILAEARNGPQVAGKCLEHLRRYLKLLVNQPQTKGVDGDE